MTIEERPRTSDDIKSDIAELEGRIVRSHQQPNYAYEFGPATRRLPELKAELERVVFAEYQAAQQARETAANAAKFKAEYGHASFEEVIADRAANDQTARIRAHRTALNAEIAEEMLAPAPTPAEQAAAELARFREAAQRAADDAA
ncbi:MAG: hypothetical protein JWQ81_6055 [Amycolatopsis sp.]|uniref:hypothetical protein n=1 Tax=Amycolatopsis sp. TaxID=37632 RepID=UPI00260C5891|nr:hypothetical protein [Amycolatopsis sp.]MCU1685316.1 hypothetical protein [Amycolatopsis sp.]